MYIYVYIHELNIYLLLYYNTLITHITYYYSCYLIVTFIFPSDPSLSPHNLAPVFRAITGDFEKITDRERGFPILPPPRARVFHEKFSFRDQLAEAAADYYALYHHDPNWKMLACCLYRAGEMAAVELARPHIQTVLGMYTIIYLHDR